MKILFWNKLSTKDRVINILCLIFGIMMFFIARMFFYIIFGFIIIMFVFKLAPYFNEMDRLNYEIKKKSKSRDTKQIKLISPQRQ